MLVVYNPREVNATWSGDVSDSLIVSLRLTWCQRVVIFMEGYRPGCIAVNCILDTHVVMFCCESE